VEVYTSHFQHKGVNLVMSSIHDITEWRRLEKIREDVERIVRHDLKSPLTGLINIPQMLLTANNLTEEQREMLGMVAASGHKMLTQINNSLELYKIESGAYRFHVGRCDPLQLVHGNIDLLSVGMDIPPGLIRIRDHAAGAGESGVTLQTDALLLDIILMNLLRNAAEAETPGGQVFVDLSRDGGEYVIAIANSRPVPREIRERFFEKYATAGKMGGTGLGTYSAALMSKAIGGRIAMETSEATGTTVTVRIPMVS